MISSNKISVKGDTSILQGVKGLIVTSLCTGWRTVPPGGAPKETRTHIRPGGSSWPSHPNGPPVLPAPGGGAVLPVVCGGGHGIPRAFGGRDGLRGARQAESHDSLPPQRQEPPAGGLQEDALWGPARKGLCPPTDMVNPLWSKKKKFVVFRDIT